MIFKSLKFETKAEKNVVIVLVIGILIMAGITFYPSVKADMGSLKSNNYYDMFVCSCCGEAIDTGCCEMSNQGKKYLDGLLSQNLDEKEIIAQMVKKFGFEILSESQNEQAVRKYIRTKSYANSPRIEIKEDRKDLGTISQAVGEVSTSFEIRNVGKGDLIIEGMDTSCMCTTASLRYDGKEGPRFGMAMHGENPENYELIIPEGESAELVVYYDTMKHGIQKEPTLRIMREVTIISNDPIDFRKKVRLDIIQIP